MLNTKELINIALRAYALRLRLRAQMSLDFARDNILCFENLLFGASQTHVARRAYSEHSERC